MSAPQAHGGEGLPRGSGEARSAAPDADAAAPRPKPPGVPLRIDRLVLRVAYAYDALPFEVFQHLRAALAGDHNIAQAVETAREVVAVLGDEDLVFVLARLLVCTPDTMD